MALTSEGVISTRSRSDTTAMDLSSVFSQAETRVRKSGFFAKMAGAFSAFGDNLATLRERHRARVEANMQRDFETLQAAGYSVGTENVPAAFSSNIISRLKSQRRAVTEQFKADRQELDDQRREINGQRKFVTNQFKSERQDINEQIRLERTAKRLNRNGYNVSRNWDDLPDQSQPAVQSAPSAQASSVSSAGSYEDQANSIIQNAMNELNKLRMQELNEILQKCQASVNAYMSTPNATFDANAFTDSIVRMSRVINSNPFEEQLVAMKESMHSVAQPTTSVDTPVTAGVSIEKPVETMSSNQPEPQSVTASAETAERPRKHAGKSEAPTADAITLDGPPEEGATVVSAPDVKKSGVPSKPVVAETSRAEEAAKLYEPIDVASAMDTPYDSAGNDSDQYLAESEANMNGGF